MIKQTPIKLPLYTVREINTVIFFFTTLDKIKKFYQIKSDFSLITNRL